MGYAANLSREQHMGFQVGKTSRKTSDFFDTGQSEDATEGKAFFPG